jgi:integrase
MATYTPEEIGAVLRAAHKDRNGHLWYLALSGLRRGEIAGLMWADVDLAAGTLIITSNRVQAGAGTRSRSGWVMPTRRPRRASTPTPRMRR